MKPGRRRVMLAMRVIFNGLTLASTLMIVTVAGLWTRNALWATSTELWFVHSAPPTPHGELLTVPADYAYLEFENGTATLGWSIRPSASWPQLAATGAVRLESRRQELGGTFWKPLGADWRFDPAHHLVPDQLHGFIADWVLLFFFAVLPAIWLVKHRRRPQPGLCLKCGYDLRASPAACPECGEPIPPKDAKLSTHS